MHIQDNILKANLKNVYFICGNACSGKTTMSRMLAEKYGFYLYDMDAVYDEHRAIATPKYQPETCYHMENHHEQWMRPIAEQARWMLENIREQSEMVLIDLIRLSQNRIVVADAMYSPDFTPEIMDPGHFIYLTVDKSLIRKTYFNRPEKRGFYEFVAKQPLAETYFENIFQGLELTNELEQQGMRRSGFAMLERTEDLSKEEMLYKIEQHFGLKK